MSEPSEPDMEAPVTRGEMHKALDIWGSAIIEKLRGEIRDLGVQLHDEIKENTRYVLKEVKGYIDSMIENFRSQIGVIDDKYNDIPARVTKLEELPERVSKLEAKVFAPKRKRRSS